MWKHIPASDSRSLKDMTLQVRRGGRLNGTVTTTSVVTGTRVVVKAANGAQLADRVMHGSWQCTGTDLRNNFYNSLTGAAFYEWVEVPNKLTGLKAAEEKVSTGAQYEPANTRVMVGKQFTKLVDGLRMVLVPYTDWGHKEMTAVVSRHRMQSNPACEVIQVHIQRDGRPFHTVSFHSDLDNKTVQDIGLFDKHTCFLIKNFDKEAPNNPFRPAGSSISVPRPVTKPAPAPTPLVINEGQFITDEDTKGKYIIWCPTADVPPKKMLCGAKQAKAVACSMSEKYGKVFYWCRLMGVARQETEEVVTIKKVTKTVTL